MEAFSKGIKNHQIQKYVPELVEKLELFAQISLGKFDQVEKTYVSYSEAITIFNVFLSFLTGFINRN